MFHLGRRKIRIAHNTLLVSRKAYQFHWKFEGFWKIMWAKNENHFMVLRRGVFPLGIPFHAKDLETAKRKIIKQEENYLRYGYFRGSEFMGCLELYRGWKIFERVDGKFEAVKINPTRYFVGDTVEQVKKSIDRREENQTLKNRIDTRFRG